ncbi:MAG: C45 family peptidase [Bdellovibrionota bacterium]
MKSMLKSVSIPIGFALLLLITFVLASMHAGVAKAPKQYVGKTAPLTGVFIDKEKHGMHQLIVKGDAFERGYNAGHFTAHLLLEQERVLFEQLERMIPNRNVLKLLTVFGANWFRGIDKYLESWATDEMYGVSLSAPKEFDFLADGFTRQIAYHGLHEVGQLLVDQGSGFACTLVAFPFDKSWIIGRNFDFEGGDVFDKEKILKWVFPSVGNAYVSVIWSGMVGVVTGVNEHGLYISLNAAGSDHFARIGTPSTLVILEALQFANSIDDAIGIFKNRQMFITDIFILTDSVSGRSVRIEKSPEKTVVTEMIGPAVVTNHLVTDDFASDEINEFRKREQTTIARQERGANLLAALSRSRPRDQRTAELGVLSILRDKGEFEGESLHLNNRSAIDALIAAHAVVYDAKRMNLFVSQGPGVSGSFTGFDLKKSFTAQTPVVIESLPGDPFVTPEIFKAVRLSERTLWKARTLIKKDCAKAKVLIEEAKYAFSGSSLYHQVAGNFAEHCENDLSVAKTHWTTALALQPAYRKDRLALEENLK